MSAENFVSAVEALHRRHGFGIVEAIHCCFDHLMEHFRDQLACSDCHACCYQLVPVFPVEWQTIEWYLGSLAQEEREAIFANAKKLVSRWRRYRKRHDVHELDPTGIFPIVRRQMLMDWKHTACIFLAEGKCAIYQARPFTCRAYASLERCSDPCQGAYLGNFKEEMDAVMYILNGMCLELPMPQLPVAWPMVEYLSQSKMYNEWLERQSTCAERKETG